MSNRGGGVGSGVNSWLNKQIAWPAGGGAPLGPFNGHPTLTTDLVAYWGMNEATDTTRADSVGARHLLVTTTAPVGAAKGGANSVEFALSGGLTVADDSTLSIAAGTSKTLAFWLYPSFTGTSVYVGKRHPSAGAPFEYGTYRTGSTIVFEMQDDLSNFKSVNRVITQSAWNFIVYWYDVSDKKLRMQVDDGIVAVSTALAGNALDSTADFVVGIGGGFSSNARFDEVAMWNRALIAQERTDLYNTGTGLFY